MSRLLRLAALAYPRTDRAAVLSLAEELVEGGASTRREAADVLRAGVAARLALTGAPWRAALDRLALPIAGLLLAAVLLGVFRQDELGWMGWSWAGGIAGILAALLGLATGRRWLALPGAALLAALCVLDGARDLYGSGSRWVAFFVDVLPALAPAALVLLLAAAAPPRAGLRAVAWTIAGAALLVLLALAVRGNTTEGTTVLGAGAALATAMAGAGGRRGAAPHERLAGAIALAAAAPAGVWSAAALAPPGAPDALAPVLLAALALGVAAWVLRLARRAVPGSA